MSDIVQIGDATLYHGDCLEILPDLGPVDSVITDPPWPNMPEGMFDIGDPYRLFNDALSVLPEHRQLVVCLRSDSDPRFLREIPTSKKFLMCVWCQYVVPGYTGRTLGGNEIAYVFGPPIPSKPGQRVIPGMTRKVQPQERPKQNGVTHPCPRTVDHQRYLVRWFSDSEAVTVLDPFMGSGTCGIACHDLNRKFIGIEKERIYFDMACERIDAAQAQGKLFA